MPIKFAYYDRYSREIGVLNDLRIILATMLLACCGSGTPRLGIECKLQPPLQRKNEAEAGV